MTASEWTTTEHALRYLSRADTFPHRTEGEGVLLDHMPTTTRRILDLGTGDGRLLALLRIDRPRSEGVGLDVSEPMLEAATERFAGDERVELVQHDMASPLPDLGTFDGIVSCFAIHHLEDERKRSLCAEVSERLEPGGVFANLEHVASPTERLHGRFYEALGYRFDWEDPSNPPRRRDPAPLAPRARLGGRRLLLEVARDGAPDRRQARGDCRSRTRSLGGMTSAGEPSAAQAAPVGSCGVAFEPLPTRSKACATTALRRSSTSSRGCPRPASPTRTACGRTTGLAVLAARLAG